MLWFVDLPSGGPQSGPTQRAVGLPEALLREKGVLGQRAYMALLDAAADHPEWGLTPALLPEWDSRGSGGEWHRLPETGEPLELSGELLVWYATRLPEREVLKLFGHAAFVMERDLTALNSREGDDHHHVSSDLRSS